MNNCAIFDLDEMGKMITNLVNETLDDLFKKCVENDNISPETLIQIQHIIQDMQKETFTVECEN